MVRTKIEPLSIFETIQKSPDFSVFINACSYCGLDKTLLSGGPYTLFAPNDEAFSKLPEGVVDAFYLPENKDKLITILTYHIIPIKLLSTDLKLGKLRTLSGKKCELHKHVGRLAIDQAPIIHFDIECENGVIHTIEETIFPEI